MKTALTIAAKDLKERLRDRSAIVMGVLVPLGLAFVMSLTIGPAADQTFETRVSLYDADGGRVAEGFSAMLDEVEELGFVTVDAAASEDEARSAVADGDVAAAYLVPEGFSAAVGSGDAASIGIVTNPDHPIGAAVITAVADGFAAEVNAVRLSAATAIALGAGDPEQLATDAAGDESPVRLGRPDVQGRGFDFSTFYANGIAIFFMFFTVQFGVLSIIGEREQGTMPRLLVAPISRKSILVGKLGASFLMGVASTIVLWFATTLLMGAVWGGALGVLVLITAGVLSAVAVAAAIATFTKTAEQAGAATAFVAVIFGVLGGVFFPVTRVSGAFAAVSRLTPHYWLMDGFKRLSAGEGLVDILPALTAVLAFTVVLGAIGLMRSRDLVKYS
ncbi:MAG: ABC transporter permease [Actinomycetota bacterium]